MHALAQVGGRDALFCRTRPIPLRYRKPKAGMLKEIGFRFGVDMTGVPCVGDSVRDLEAAEAVGAQPLLVLTGKGEKTCATAIFEEYGDLPGSRVRASAFTAD
jgi:D-glycero-D-manno-heptose 1,7-bisphosphate phosphatase